MQCNLLLVLRTQWKTSRDGSERAERSATAEVAKEEAVLMLAFFTEPLPFVYGNNCDARQKECNSAADVNREVVWIFPLCRFIAGRLQLSAS